VKSLIAEIKNRYGYTVMYKKAWMAKQKALAMEFGEWKTHIIIFQDGCKLYKKVFRE